jgi:hypothetical protein
MVASALLILGVMGIFGACLTALRTLQMTNNRYHATCIARNRVQRALSLPFNTLPMLEASDQAVDQYGNASANGTFLMSTSLTELGEHCYEITVEVSYPVRIGELSEVPATIRSKIARGMHGEEIEE